MPQPGKIKVLVVDDSAVVRKVLTEELSRTRDIEVVATAIDPYIARDKIVQLRPDVITLDIEMPRMDGLTFLGKLMKYAPMPVIVVSSVTPAGSEAAMKALELGAVDVIAKPGSAYTVSEISEMLIDRIRAAARVRMIPSRRAVMEESPSAAPSAAAISSLKTTHKILALGASTGGTVALEKILRSLPASTPGTVICQHMPANFTRSFAQRLNQQVPMEVREARDGDMLVPGLALIAPGNFHMVLVRSGARYHVQVKDGPRVHHQKPAVDVLFHSVAQHAGPNALGVILTGMGGDGADGLMAMRSAGARTLGQDEASSVVYGMPKRAYEVGAVERQVSLDLMARTIVDVLSRELNTVGSA